MTFSSFSDFFDNLRGLTDLGRLSEKVKIHLSVTPAKAGAHADKHTLCLNGCPHTFGASATCAGMTCSLFIDDQSQKKCCLFNCQINNSYKRAIT